MYKRFNIKLPNQNTILLITALISIIFWIALILDISPYIRGPFDPIIESHWPYYFVNTYQKIWAPLLVIFFTYLLFIRFENQKKLNLKKEFIYVLFFSFLIFLFQIALVYFSRFGITVLFRRLVDPGINGYFSTAIAIDNIGYYISNYHEILLSFDQHARGHPPGSVLFLKVVINFFDVIHNNYSSFFYLLDTLKVGWAKNLWDSLSASERGASIFIPFLLHLITGLIFVPLYYLAKIVTDNIILSVRTALLFTLIPSFSFFALTFDPIYTGLLILSLLQIALGVKRNKIVLLFTSGITTAVALFFSLSVIPACAIIILFIIFNTNRTNISRFIKYTIIFTSGFLSFFTILELIGFRTINSFHAVLSNQTPRDYLTWVIFNPYDFFVYLSIPATVILLVFMLFNKLHKNNGLESKLNNSFWIIFLTLIISGVSRGEVGRIWLPIMLFPIFVTVIFITKTLKLSTQKFWIFLIFTIIQVIIMEEYWVPIW